MNIERFIEARKQANLSQEELAQGICTQATLSRFERGGNVPSIKILTRLCNRLALDMAELFKSVSDSREEMIEKRLHDAEFDLIISEYDHAQEKLATLELTEIECQQFGQRFDFIQGYIAILSGRQIQKTLEQYHTRLIQRHDLTDVYTLLNYCGLGMGYARLNKPDLAEQYFNVVFTEVMNVKRKNTADTWKVLTILFYTAEFYSTYNLETSNQLLQTIVSICSSEHITFYLARAVLQLAENEAAGDHDPKQLTALLMDAYAYAKINNNSVELQRIQTLMTEWQLINMPAITIYTL